MSNSSQFSNGIKGIQRGVISIPNTSLTATATITAVVTAKTELRLLGWAYAGTDVPSSTATLQLTNSTTITATRQFTTLGLNVSWELTEFY